MLGDVTGTREAARISLFLSAHNCVVLGQSYHHGDSLLLASRCRRDSLDPVLFSVTAFRVLGHSDLRPVPKFVSSKRNGTSELFFDQNPAFKAAEGPASLNAPGHLVQGRRRGVKELTEPHRSLKAADVVNTKVLTSTWLTPEALCGSAALLSDLGFCCC